MTTATVAQAYAEATLTVSDLARKTGAAPSAIRFYERQGLVISERTPGNQRRFYEVEECIVKIIRVAQRVGLSVAEIREFLDQLPGRPDVTVEDWLAVRERLEAEVRHRLRALEEALNDLTGTPKVCDVPSG